MTKILRKTLFVAVAALLGVSIEAVAQDMSYTPEAKIPVNPQVKKGKLKNGLTYYIRQNSLPENKVELRMVVNAGSVLENEDQRGLAHFTEHMAFNGSRDFPGNALIERLEEIGVRFGQDLNAYTSFDETVYILPVPKDQLDLGLSVLQNWAFHLNMTEEDIDGERGVILEEQRLGRGASERLAEKYYPVLLGGSKYPDRMPIGTEEVLRTFSYDTIRDFYHTWYRPDNIAIIVVGDMDPAYVEAKIKEMFGKQKNPKKAPERKEEVIPTFKGSKAVVVTDREMPTTQVQVLYRVGQKPSETQKDYMDDIKASLYGTMLSMRYQEIMQQPGAPFMYAQAGYSTLLRREKGFSLVAVCAPGGSQKAFHSLLTEAERAQRFGFTQSELDRAKAAVMSRMEVQYSNREKALSAHHLGELQRNFLVGENIPGIEYEYKLIKAAMPAITLEEVNALGDELVTEDNRVVIVIGPEGLPYPSEKELLDIFDAVEKDQSIEAYKDNMTVTKLMEKAPAPGKVVAEKTYEKSGVTEWILSNGAKVYLKPTTFREDEVLFYAYSHGGRSLVAPEDDCNAYFSTQIAQQSGLNGIKATDLRKLLTGKNVRCGASINAMNETLNGSYVEKDAKTAFELLYLNFTAPYFDKEAFEIFKKNGKARTAHAMEDPDTYFSYKQQEFLANGNPRFMAQSPLPEYYDKVTLEGAERVYRSRFAGADDFTFCFVGSFTLEEIKPLIETYVASLPAAGVKETYKDITYDYPARAQEKILRKGVDAKANVRMVWRKYAPYDDREAFNLSVFSDVLSTRLLKSLREEMGGTYSVGAAGRAQYMPKEYADFIMVFSSNLDMYTPMYERALADTKKLLTEGPTEDEVAAKKEQYTVQWAEQIKNNNFWMSMLNTAISKGQTPDSVLERESHINSLNVKDVQAAGQKYLDVDQWIRIISLPEEK